jgi:phospholipid/cholesterol/gamma-HCH transport system ATP-binding protein
MDKPKGHIDFNDTVISIRGLRKSFGDLHILRGVDLDLYQGENLVVLGRSGMGKSVLIKIISGLLKADGGSVKVLGEEVTNITEQGVAKTTFRYWFLFSKQRFVR